jgi:hypothetical protein
MYVEVIATIGLRDVAECIREIPLSARRACVVARRGLGVKAELCHKASPYIVVVEVAADSELGQLHFTRAKDFSRSADCVALRVAEIIGIVSV